MRDQEAVDDDARRWWSEREASAEKDISQSLYKRMEAQRAQIHAFKLEQSKWEHELQLRISKYAHDRKLLSEQNIELQETLMAMEDKYARLQRDNDLQAVQILELEGQRNQFRVDDRQFEELRSENKRLTERVMQLEAMRSAHVATALKQQEQLHIEWVSALEAKLDAAVKECARLREECASTDRIRRRVRSDSAADASAAVAMANSEHDRATEVTSERSMTRITELEKSLKQKDQTIVSLKAMLERHESISDEKIKLLQAKYDQVKTINVSLQRRILRELVIQEDRLQEELPQANRIQ